MASLVDKIVVVDSEATCWQEEPPADQVSDIIEIGLVTLDVRDLRLGKKRSILIRPSRSTVSAFCTKLTSLTQGQVQRGSSLEEACSLLRDEYETNIERAGNYSSPARRERMRSRSSIE